MVEAPANWGRSRMYNFHTFVTIGPYLLALSFVCMIFAYLVEY